MKFYMTELEKGDLLIQVSALWRCLFWECLTVLHFIAKEKVVF